MNLFENAVIFIDELVKIRNKQNEIFISEGKTKESTEIIFKIKSYKKWIEKTNQHMLGKTIINNKDDIIKLNFSDKLTKHIVELYEKGNILEMSELKSAKLELLELQKTQKTQKTQQIQSNTTTKETITFKPSIKSSINEIPKNEAISKEGARGNKDSFVLDTSTIEAKPKILNGEVRPSDIRGGSIFDLRYIHGIGPVNAIKLYDEFGVTLEGLLSEWKDWTTKDISNTILMPSKMCKPKQYTKTQWDALDKYKQYSILETNLKKKLDTETKQLCKIHRSSLVGLKHFNDMSLKIPREEIQKAEIILKKLASHMNKDLLVMICGSYRRGKEKSGDVDCLIAHPLIKTKLDLDNNPVNLLHNFVTLLINSNFIVDQIDMGSKKFMGFCNTIQFINNTHNHNNHNHNTANSTPQQPYTPQQPIARRIDIRFVPFESYGSAVLYFTGSRKFNTDMRTHAIKKGYSLNEFGLTKIDDGTIIPCSNEEEIFKILKYPYKKPEERDI